MFCDGGLACGQSVSQEGTHMTRKTRARLLLRLVTSIQCSAGMCTSTRVTRAGGTLNKCAEMMQASKGSSRMTDGQGNSFVRLMRGGGKKKGDGLDFCSCNCRRPASVALVTKSFFFFFPLVK